MTTQTLTPTRRRAPASRHSAPIWLAAAALMIVLAPVVLLAGAANPPCPTAPADSGVSSGVAPAGMFAAALALQPGRWYQVGATEYGGPNDRSAGDYGSIGGNEGFLPAHPDTFAELSVLDSNPANGGTFTFADANALNNLPYMTGLRVQNNGAQKILFKRDTGYGQGPGQTIANGQPYRLDVWWQSAAALGISKSPVQVQLAPPAGTAATLNQLPAPTAPNAGAAAGACPTPAPGTLTLSAGDQAQILADGSAAAPADAPHAVKLAIAAANQIHTKPYAIGPTPVHYGSLAQLWPAYDCSGAVSYVLYQAGLHSPWPDVSGALESWGQPGPGRWITVYANSTHAFIDIAGLAFDTADYGGPNIPAGPGPRWRQNPTANLQDGLAYTARHPTGL